MREETLVRSVANDFAAREVVERLFEKARGRRIRIRYLEIVLTDLREAPRQLSLFEDSGGNGAAAGNGVAQGNGGPPGERGEAMAMAAAVAKERREGALTAALDRIRERFGVAAVGFKRRVG